jgi:hypothetical protein
MDAQHGSALCQIAQDNRERGFDSSAAVRNLAREPEGLQHPYPVGMRVEATRRTISRYVVLGMAPLARKPSI